MRFVWPSPFSLQATEVSSHTTLAADFSGRDSDAQVGRNINCHLDLAALLDALDGSLGEQSADLPDLLAVLLLLLFVRVKVRVVLILLRLSLGLGLGDLDVSTTLDDLDKDITALFRSGDLDRAASRGGSLGSHDGSENILTVGTNSDDTNGVGDVLKRGDSGMGGLLDVGSLVLLDQRGLEGSTTGLELRGVDGQGAGGRSKNSGGLREDAAEVVGDAGDVRGTTAHDNLIDIKNVETGLLDDTLNQSVEALKDLTANHLKSYPVDGDRVVEAVRQALHAKLSVATQAQGSLGGLGLKTKLGQAAGVVSGVDVVLLLELLGEVVHEGLVKVNTGELVVVGGGENGVHATARGDNSNIGTSATKIGDNNDLVLNSGLGTSIIGEDSGDGFGNELEDLDISSVGGGDQGLALLLREVGGNSDDGRSDLLAKVVGGRADNSSQVSGGGLGDGDRRGLLISLVLNIESN